MQKLNTVFYKRRVLKGRLKKLWLLLNIYRIQLQWNGELIFDISLETGYGNISLKASEYLVILKTAIHCSPNTYTDTHRHTFIIFIYRHTHLHMHAYIYIYIYRDEPLKLSLTKLQIWYWIFIPSLIYTDALKHTYAYAYTYIYINTHK